MKTLKIFDMLHNRIIQNSNPRLKILATMQYYIYETKQLCVINVIKITRFFKVI